MQNTITITFTHSEAEQTKYTFGDRVALMREGEPQQWETGKVVGLYLDEISKPKWYYTIKLDLDGCMEDCLAKDLVPDASIPQQF